MFAQLTSAMRITSIALFLFASFAHVFAGEGADRLKKAEDAFSESQKKQETAFRSDVAAALLHATRCEVYLLDFDMSDVIENSPFKDYPSDTEHFPIRPYRRESKILKRTEVKGAELQNLLPTLAPVIGVTENTYGALCHYPIHGIRVYDGPTLLLETSFCYGCSNFYMTYPYSGSHWVGLNSSAIEKALSVSMPIPDSEKARFNAKDKKPSTSKKK